MEQPHYIVDATPENFDQLVIGNSGKGPVVVNYWAPWAGPCLKLWPVLERLAREFGGRLLLVNVNTDKYRQLARAFGVNSLPTVKVFRNGKVVDQVFGAETETALRSLFQRHLPRASDRQIAEAVRDYQQGAVEAALDRLRDAAAEDPGNPRAGLTLAKLLLREQRLDEAEAALLGMPEELRNQAEPSTLLAHVLFMRALDQAPAAETLERHLQQQPEDARARFQLAAHRVVDDRYEEALQQLLEILRRRPGHRDESASRGLRAIFNLLGREHPLTRQYQKELRNLLH